MCPHQLGQFRRTPRTLLCAAGDVHDVRHDEVSQFVEHRDFATGAEPRINREHSLTAQRRLQQQAAQVPSEHVNRVTFGLIGKLAANFAFETRLNQPLHRVRQTTVEKLAMRMRLPSVVSVAGCLDGDSIPLEFDSERTGFLTAIDRQHAVRRNSRGRFRELEVVAVLLPALRSSFGGCAGEFARFPRKLSTEFSQRGLFGNVLGKNIGRPLQHFDCAGQVLLRIHERGSGNVEVRQFRITGPDARGQRFESALARGGGS